MISEILIPRTFTILNNVNKKQSLPSFKNLFKVETLILHSLQNFVFDNSFLIIYDICIYISFHINHLQVFYHPTYGIVKTLSQFWDIFITEVNDMNKFSDRLKDLRINMNLSIDNLSKQVNISSSSICRWELGQSDIKSTQLIILANFFGVSTDYLLGLEE